MKKKFRIIVVSFLSVFVLFTLVAQNSAYAYVNHTNVVNHCVTHLAPLQSGQTTSQVLSTKCFQTFSESIADATGGRVHLSSTVQPHNLTQAMLNSSSLAPQASYVLSIEYWDSNFGGATWALSGNWSCSQLGGYGLGYVGDTWNDQISSSLGYSGCNHVIHWENSSFGGSSIDCSCATMGVMNDQTSSIQWHS